MNCFHSFHHFSHFSLIKLSSHLSPMATRVAFPTGADPFPVPAFWASENTENLSVRLNDVAVWNEVAAYEGNTSSKTADQCRVRLGNYFQYSRLRKQNLANNFVENADDVWTQEEDKWLVKAVTQLVNWVQIAEGVPAHFRNAPQVSYTADQCCLEFVNVYMVYEFAHKERRRALFLYDWGKPDGDYCNWVTERLRAHGFSSVETMPAISNVASKLVEKGYENAIGESPGLKNLLVNDSYDFDLILIEWGKKGKRDVVEKLKKINGRRRPFTVVVYEAEDEVPDGMGPSVDGWMPKDKEWRNIQKVIEKMEIFNFAV